MAVVATLLHAGQATARHLLVDTLLGIGGGLVLVAAFLVALRWRRSSSDRRDDGDNDVDAFDRLG
jgi:hypothetical protein